MNNEVCEKDISDPKSASELKQIMENGVTTTDNGKSKIHCLSIIGQIEGHFLLSDSQKATKYEHLMPLIVSVEESTEINGMLIILNTVGGDVEAGLAISEMIASMSKPTASLVLGGGHSIGVPLAASAKRSFIVPSATMTLHPVRINGLVLGVEQTYEYFKKMQERIIAFTEKHSGISADQLRKYMLRTDEIATDMGTVLEGPEAVECGLIDEIGGLSSALGWLHNQIEDGAKQDYKK